MAVQPSIVTRGAFGGNFVELKWSNLANNDTGAPVALPEFINLMGAVYGTFGSGGSCTFEMSPDGGTTWIDLKTLFAQGVPATAAGAFLGYLTASLLRPIVTAGDGSTLLNVLLLANAVSTGTG